MQVTGPINMKRNRIALLMVSVALLGGCDELGLQAGSSADTEAQSSAPGVLRIEDREIEAPEVFSYQDRALWDGRPSLGGVWVAVPQNVQPERVRITNESNGRSIQAALFRREAENPGPPIQVSSAAAAELGMLGGSPVDMTIVALRRETVEVQPVAAPENLNEPVEVERLPEVTAETAAVEATALASLEPDATDEAAEAVVEATDASAEALGAAVTAALDEETPSEAEALAELEPEVVLPPALPEPYLQVASFSDRKSAAETVTDLNGKGVTAEGRIVQASGTLFYNVVVGPSTTEEERTALAEKLKTLGFTESFATQ